MEIRLPEIIPDKNKPFDGDKLDREKYADILTKIVDKYADGFVMALNNEWGAGKTTFVKMWKQKLDDIGFKTLYYNAWENDFENDVLVALLSELQVLDDSKGEKAYKELVTKAGPLAKAFGIGLIKTLINKYAGEEFSEALEGVTEAINVELQEQIDKYTSRKKGINEFKKALAEYTEELSNGKPIIFFIDELDRCRPSYAVEVLEMVKHLFSVKGVVFVLSIDKVQLEHAIKGYYGSESINAKEYLRRFIDLEYSLPDPDTSLFCNYLYESFKFYEFMEIPIRTGTRVFAEEKNNFLRFSSFLFQNMHLTLRMQEKIYGRVRLALLMFEFNRILVPDLLIFLMIIKDHYLYFYSRLIGYELSLQELVSETDKIFLENTSQSFQKNIFQIVKVQALLLMYYHHDLVTNQNSRQKLWVEGEGVEPKLKVKSTIKADYTLDYMVNDIEHRYMYPKLPLSYLTNKIDLLDKIEIS